MNFDFFSHFKTPFENPVLVFSTILFVILFAPIIFNKLKIPHLIGLILAGLVLGPHGFSVLLHGESIKLYGTVGLIYILLIAGLEININDFKKNSFKSLVFGLYTFIIPMVIGYYLGYYIFNYSALSSVLLASLFASHTLITYPIINKLGVTKNKAVSIALGGTFITDTLALLVLAVVVGLSNGEDLNNFWVRLIVSFFVFSTVVVLVLPAIMKWFLKSFKDSVSQFIFVLAMTFLSAFLAIVAGFDPIIGAFMAGLAFNKLVPKSSPLMSRIEFVGNAIFIPIFLISVGMLIDLRVFFNDFYSLKVAGLMTLVAIFAKYLAALFTQKTFRLSADERRIIFGLSNSQAAVTLAAVMVGYNVILGYDSLGNPLRLLNDDVLNGSIIMILITCTISSFVTQKGASNIAINELVKIDSEDSEYEERILLPINDDNLSEDIVNLCLCLKTPANKKQIYAFTVINNHIRDLLAEKKASIIHEKAHESLIDADVDVQKLIRYNININQSITSVINEFNITDVIFGIKKNKLLVNEYFNYISSQITNNQNVTNYLYQSIQPITTINKYKVVVPDKSEREIGFVFWLIKLWNISRNTGAKIVFYSSENTLKYIKIVNQRHSINADFVAVSDFSEISQKFIKLKTDECVVFVLSGNEYSNIESSSNDFANCIGELSGKTNLLLIYPTKINDISDPLSPYNSKVFRNLISNLEKIDDFGKNITSIFKRNVTK